MANNWLKDMMEEFSYKYYLENYPNMVEGIKQLLARGEKAAKIKQFVNKTVGKSLTSNLVGHMIDHIKRQTDN